MCISSNVALSMGMVGALSIVRFRTAVKDPMDTAYMFWDGERRAVQHTAEAPLVHKRNQQTDEQPQHQTQHNFMRLRSSSRRRLRRLSSCSLSCISRRRTPTCSLFTMMKSR